MNIKRKYIVLAVIPVITLVAWFIYQGTLFRMTSTTPDLSKVSSLSPFIDINFSKQIDPESINITTEDIDVTSFEANNKTLRVFIGEIEADSDYTFTIDSISAKSGKALQNIKISFTAKNIPFEKLSKSQQQAILQNQDRTDNTKSDGILGYLPYGGLHFKLNANQDGDQLVLEAEILLSKADLGTGQETVIETYKKEVTDFIQSKNLDPDDYTINYKIIQPSIY